jgi:hypothetical protein
MQAEAFLASLPHFKGSPEWIMHRVSTYCHTAAAQAGTIIVQPCKHSVQQQQRQRTHRHHRTHRSHQQRHGSARDGKSAAASCLYLITDGEVVVSHAAPAAFSQRPTLHVPPPADTPHTQGPAEGSALQRHGSAGSTEAHTAPAKGAASQAGGHSDGAGGSAAQGSGRRSFESCASSASSLGSAGSLQGEEGGVHHGGHGGRGRGGAGQKAGRGRSRSRPAWCRHTAKVASLDAQGGSSAAPCPARSPSPAAVAGHTPGDGSETAEQLPGQYPLPSMPGAASGTSSQASPGPGRRHGSKEAAVELARLVPGDFINFELLLGLPPQFCVAAASGGVRLLLLHEQDLQPAFGQELLRQLGRQAGQMLRWLQQRQSHVQASLAAAGAERNRAMAMAGSKGRQQQPEGGSSLQQQEQAQQAAAAAGGAAAPAAGSAARGSCSGEHASEIDLATDLSQGCMRDDGWAVRLARSSEASVYRATPAAAALARAASPAAVGPREPGLNQQSQQLLQVMQRRSRSVMEAVSQAGAAGGAGGAAGGGDRPGSTSRCSSFDGMSAECGWDGTWEGASAAGTGAGSSGRSSRGPSPARSVRGSMLVAAALNRSSAAGDTQLEDAPSGPSTLTIPRTHRTPRTPSGSPCSPCSPSSHHDGSRCSADSTPLASLQQEEESCASMPTARGPEAAGAAGAAPASSPGSAPAAPVGMSYWQWLHSQSSRSLAGSGQVGCTSSSSLAVARSCRSTAEEVPGGAAARRPSTGAAGGSTALAEAAPAAAAEAVDPGEGASAVGATAAAATAAGAAAQPYFRPISALGGRCAASRALASARSSTSGDEEDAGADEADAEVAAIMAAAAPPARSMRSISPPAAAPQFRSATCPVVLPTGVQPAARLVHMPRQDDSASGNASLRASTALGGMVGRAASTASLGWQQQSGGVGRASLVQLPGAGGQGGAASRAVPLTKAHRRSVLVQPCDAPEVIVSRACFCGGSQ